MSDDIRVENDVGRGFAGDGDLRPGENRHHTPRLAPWYETPFLGRVGSTYMAPAGLIGYQQPSFFVLFLIVRGISRRDKFYLQNISN